jgi:hypothetical protein
MITYFSLLLGKIRFWAMRHKADALHDTTGKRYYVIPCGGKNMLVACNNDIKALKKRGIIKQNIDHLTIMENCLYYTDNDGKASGRMSSDKVARNAQQWQQHLHHLRHKRKSGK